MTQPVESAHTIAPANGVRTIWFYGLPGAGKSTLADALCKSLRAVGLSVVRLDGDVLRQGLNTDLGFGEQDRRENLRRAAELARLLNDQGLTVVASFISPMSADRAMVRAIVGDRLLDVFVDTPLEVCEARDPKGHYRKARAMQLMAFTGVSAPFERPVVGLHVTTLGKSVEQALMEVQEALLRPT